MSKIDYTNAVRIPKHTGFWDGQRCGLSGKSESAFWFRYFYPNIPYSKHKELAAKYLAKSKNYQKRYSRAVDAAFMSKFGRKPTATDYKVSGIYSDDLHEADKNKIRVILAKWSHFEGIARLHNYMLKKADQI